MITIDAQRLFAEPSLFLSRKEAYEFRQETIRLLELFLSGKAQITNATPDFIAKVKQRLDERESTLAHITRQEQHSDYWVWRVSQGQQNPHFSPYRHYN